MLTYTARAVPWPRVVLAAGLVVLLMELVRWNPWVLWPLEGTAVGLLAGATAWCFDETAAVVVDTSPRSLAWRTAVRGPAVVLLALVWSIGVLRTADAAAFGHGAAILAQGLAAIAAGAGHACWRRARGVALPGLVLATVVVPAATAWALLRPFATHLPVFPYGDNTMHQWQVSTLGWTVLGVLGALLVLAAVADAPWWGRQPRWGSLRR